MVEGCVHYEARSFFFLIVDVEHESLVLHHLWVVKPLVVLRVLRRQRVVLARPVRIFQLVEQMRGRID